jgi:hypothetical protein
MTIFDDITQEEIENGELPLAAILQNSFYYPSSGLDGGIIRDCNTIERGFEIVSFVYCDYAMGQEAFVRHQNTFLGYAVLGSRMVNQRELIPMGWNPQLPPGVDMRRYQRYQDSWDQFIMWTVYERNDDRGNEHGPRRFSLLYLGGEGVATYQALYWSNRVTPKALAIIQPGTGFGLNWTDFRDKNGPLAWVVKNNPAGQPKIIYYGGMGNGYDDFNWDGYTEQRIIMPYYSTSGEARVLYYSP